MIRKKTPLFFSHKICQLFGNICNIWAVGRARIKWEAQTYTYVIWLEKSFLEITNYKTKKQLTWLISHAKTSLKPLVLAQEERYVWVVQCRHFLHPLQWGQVLALPSLAGPGVLPQATSCSIPVSAFWEPTQLLTRPTSAPWAFMRSLRVQLC